jgi:hypothetical protein
VITANGDSHAVERRRAEKSVVSFPSVSTARGRRREGEEEKRRVEGGSFLT